MYEEKLQACVSQDPAIPLAEKLATALIEEDNNPLFHKRVVLEMVRILLSSGDQLHKETAYKRDSLNEKVHEIGSCLETLHSIVKTVENQNLR